jgi:Flp pilus assembly protein TadG
MRERTTTRRHRRDRGERGAAIVEAAIGTVLVCTLLFGVVEFGLAFKDYLSMSAAVRDGARVATTQGSSTLADYLIIKTVKQRMPAVATGNIQRIVVFKATGPTSTIDSVSSTCKTSSVTNVCNSYGPTDFSRPSTDFTGATPSPDRYWPPANRKDTLAGPPDYVGVWVQISHKNITGFFNLGSNYSDNVVMRIEPATIS